MRLERRVQRADDRGRDERTRVVRANQVLDRLGGMTAVDALSAGEEPRVVWNVLCDQMGIPDSQRWGKDHNAPPMPVR